MRQVRSTNRSTRLAAPRLLLAALTCALVPAVVGCVSQRLPPINESPDGETLVGKFVWFDLLTEDPDAARSFYAGLFGWSFDGAQGPKGYLVIRQRGVPIGGIARHDARDSEAPESLWLPSLSVADVDASARVVEAQGGEILDGPTDVEARGRMAVVRDPAGALLILLRANGGDPPDAAPELGAFMWTDLFVRDAPRSSAFYRELVGYKAIDVDEGGGHVFQVLLRDGRARAGIVELRVADAEPNWLPYVRVKDVDGVVARARELGGRVLFHEDDVAVLVDPTGGAFGVQRPEPKRGRS